jgi:hypothetical protein
MLTSLDSVDLALVSGGQNVTTVTTPQGSRTSERTDYAVCTDMVQQACTQKSTGWLGTDRAAAGQCTIDQMPKACGLPPLPGGASTGQ